MQILFLLLFTTKILGPGLDADFYREAHYIRFSFINKSEDCYLQIETIKKTKPEILYTEKENETTFDISFKIEVLVSTHVKVEIERCNVYVLELLSRENQNNKTNTLREIISEYFSVELVDFTSSVPIVGFSFRFLYVNGKFIKKGFEEFVWSSERVSCLEDKASIEDDSMQMQEKLNGFSVFAEGLRRRTLVQCAVWACRKSTKKASENYFNGKFLVNNIFHIFPDLEISVYYALPLGDSFGTMNREKFEKWIKQ